MLLALGSARRPLALLALAVAATLCAPRGWSQPSATVVLPYTISTVAGGGSTSSAGAACSPGSPYKAADAYGDGCPATSAIFGNDLQGGVAADPFGNLFVGDTNNNVVRRIDARSGIITIFAGGQKICAAALDKLGDGCPVSETGGFNHPRGVAADPYGNVLIAGYGDNLVHLVCNAVSPLCTSAQLGTMRLAAGCTTNSSSYGGKGNTGDGLTGAGACGATVATVNQPRGAAADIYGNVYVADTGNDRIRVVVGPGIPGQTNPLIAMLQVYPAYSGITAASAPGKIYALVGGGQFSAPKSGAACSSGSASVSLDGSGDGCPFYNTSLTTSGGFVHAVAADPSGNVIFSDANGTGRLRVLYAGGAGNRMAAAITANNPTVLAPQVGYSYSIAGAGQTNSIRNTPVLGSTTSLDGSMYRVIADKQGNIFVGDNTSVLFFDTGTGYIRRIATSGSLCSGKLDKYGDGCPATAASFGGSSNVLGVALDNRGNLYLADGANNIIRKVSATRFGATTIGTPSTPGLFVHAPPGTTSITPTLAPHSDFSLGKGACAVNTPPGDLSYDCVFPVAFAPTELGLRTAPVSIQPSGGGAAVLKALTAQANGSSLVFDPSLPANTSDQTAGAVAPVSIAVDGSGNLFTASAASKELVEIAGGATTSISSPLTGLPGQIAVNARGDVFAAIAGSPTIVKLNFAAPSTFTAGTISNPAFASASAVAVDANGNVYVAGDPNGSVVKFSQTSGLAETLTATPLGAVSALALDNQGNLLVAEKTGGVVYRLSTNGVASGLPAKVAVAGSIAPVGVAADQAGDVYIADAASNSVIAVPSSGPQFTVATGFTAINGVAVDGAGNVFVSDSSRPGVVEILRSQFAFSFGTSTSASLAGTITNAGDSTSLGFAQTDPSDFQLTGPGSTCNPSATAIYPGESCAVVAGFAPTANGGGPVSDAISLQPVASTLGSLTLNAVKNGLATTTITTIGGANPAAPVYVAGGATVSVAVAVTASSGNATGNIYVALDSGAATTYQLSPAGAAVISFAGLGAGTHIVTAIYPSQGGVSGSTAAPFSFAVAQASTSLTWKPASSTEQFSQAIGTGVFDATSGGVPGAYVYTASRGSGPAIMVDSASYLPIGAYSLNVVFTPDDAADYTGSSASFASFTVTKAATVAAVGATHNVVAADGTGNFPSVAAAVAALPPTGGTVYIAPGTYTGQFSIAYPNVSLRGLGGDAEKVLITAERGAFSAPFPAGNSGSYGDQGSSTVVVTKGTVNGTQYFPNGFYAENLSIANTYDSDAANSNTLATVGGVCTANQPANNNFALYNNGTLCASQALALWNTADKSVLNNVRLISLQDTLYAGSQGCGNVCLAARQYFWKGYITGDVDYIFGDAALVFDQTTFFTTYHGTKPTGTETIEAQNKKAQTGSAADYLSGYIMNSCSLTSQSAGMTQLFLGRPYGPYSTNILLNTYIDQSNPTGWIEFSGDNNLPTSTYAEFNSTGPGAAGPRETISLRPEQLTAAEAAKYAPVTFLSTPAPDVWNPAAALAAGVNSFVPAGTAASAPYGSSITLLARPQTPGGGAIPTGTYSLMDGATVLASGALDASGEAYFTTKALAAGAHSITLAYGGDSNFSASTSATPYVLTVGASATALAFNPATPVYGSTVAVQVAVKQGPGSSAPTGNVTLSVDGNAATTAAVAGGSASFSLPGLSAGAHAFTAIYSGDGTNASSTATGTINIAPASLTVAAPSPTAIFGAAIPPFAPAYSGFVNGDAAATALTGAPTFTTTPASPTNAGTYTIIPSAGTLAAKNYTFVFVDGVLTIAKAGSKTALVSSDSSPGPGAAISYTATVTSATTGTPTGSVSFYNGTALLNDITLNASGVAVYSTTFAATGGESVTAVYSGSGNFNPSTSSVLAQTGVAPGFTFAASPSALSAARGGNASAVLTFTPVGNYQGTATLSCSGLPVETVCTFATPTVSFTGNNAAVQDNLVISVLASASAATAPRPFGDRRPLMAGLLLLPAFMLPALLALRRKGLIRPGGGLLALALLGCFLVAMAGCGGSSGPTAPLGSQTITINASSTNGMATVSQSATVTLNITK